MKTTHVLVSGLTLLLSVTLASPEAHAQPSRKAYLETLLARARGTLTNMKHGERSSVSWSRARWGSIETSNGLLDWFDETHLAGSVAYRLKAARDQTRKLIVFEDTAEQTAAQILAELDSLEAAVFKHALRGTFGEQCATFDSTVDERPIFVEPSTDSEQVSQVRRSQYVTLLEGQSDWIRVRFWTGSQEVQGYMEGGNTLEVYGAPATPPKLLQKPAPKTPAAARAHYLRVLEFTTQGVLSNLPHRERSYAHSVREHWQDLGSSGDLLAFFESNENGVARRLETAMKETRWLAPLDAEQLSRLDEEQVEVLKKALMESARLTSATFDSSVDERAMFVSPDTRSPIRTQIRRGQTVVLLESDDPDWIKVRYFDTEYLAEGYMERGNTLVILASPEAQAPTADAGLDSSFIDTLLGAQRR